MNAKQLLTIATVAAVTGFGSSIAFAAEATVDSFAPSTKSRAEVRAELAQAQRDGSIAVSSLGYFEQLASVKTRAEVRNEAALALARGELSPIYGELSPTSAKTQIVARSAR